MHDDDTNGLHEQLSQIDVAHAANQDRTQAEETLQQARVHLGHLGTMLEDLARLIERADNQARVNDAATDLDDGNSIAAPGAPDSLPNPLASEAAFARALLDASTDELEVIDAEGTIIYLNEALTRRLGKGPDDLIGASIWDCLLYTSPSPRDS